LVPIGDQMLFPLIWLLYEDNSTFLSR
jgi:hypothetical protein